MLRFRKPSLGARIINQYPSLVICKRKVVIPQGQKLRVDNNNGGSLRRRRRIKSVSLDDLTLNSLDRYNSKELEFKVKQLQAFTRNLKDQIRKADKIKEIVNTDNNSIDENQLNADVGALFESLSLSSSTDDKGQLPCQQENQITDLSSFIIASTKTQANKLLPAMIGERIQDDKLVIKFLVDESNQNWNPIVSKLYESDRQLQDIDFKDLKASILAKIKNLSLENIEKLDEMFLSNINNDITKFNTTMFECMFMNLSSIKNNKVQSNESDGVVLKMKQLLERFDKAAVEGTSTTMTQFILNRCLTYSSSQKNFDDMNYFLVKFKSYGITPNKENYTTVLQFYYKLGISKQAWDIFDTMKYLSQSHSPDVTVYNTMLLFCNKEKNYSKALDLYNEMVAEKLTPTTDTFNIMAKTLATASRDSFTSEGKSESLRLLGWKFIHEIEDNSGSNFAPRTIESMMALSAYDGDIGLSRALYFNYVTSMYKETVKRWNGPRDERNIWKNVLNPQLLNYLLLAYSKHKPQRLPLLLGYDNGIVLRRNIINSVDYSGRSVFDDDVKIVLPLLPVSDINKPWEILAESRALWHFNLEFGGVIDMKQNPIDSLTKDKILELVSSSKSIEEFKFNIMHKVVQWKEQLINHRVLNPILLNTYLSIPLRLGDEKEFLLRLKEFSFQQHDLDEHISKIFNDRSIESITDDVSVKSNELDSELIIKETNDKYATFISYITSMKHKILTNCAIYEIMMKGASTFRNSSLATYSWEERGKFRKTASFQQLATKKRLDSDSKFATLMVHFFTNQDMCEDALHIVMSSKKYIDWDYSMIRSLHKKLEEIEDHKSISILLDIINKKSSLQIIDEQIKELNM